MRRLATWLIAATVSGAALGCSLGDQSTPSLSGPSEFGLSVTATATPNTLPRDGRSQSEVTLTVRDAQGRPVSGQRLVIGVSPTSATLSATEIVTDASGRATVTVTAPPASALAGTALTLTATPVGTSAADEQPRAFSISLTGSANTTLPTPSFTVTPTSPEVNQVTTLDASATTDEGATCLDLCTYSWDLGGEATRTGRIITYRFQSARIYNVALTVTDRSGASATTRTNVTVTAAARPTVTFTSTPTSPVAGQLVTFTTTTTVATNHTITQFSWNFGDGSSSQTTNASITHAFSPAGTYVVTVTVTDDLGQTASSTGTVSIGQAITASFNFSPTNPRVRDEVTFDGSASTAPGATIIEWVWDFGDGEDPGPEIHTQARASHVYLIQRTFVVRLTVRDSQGRTGTTTQNVAVAAP